MKHLLGCRGAQRAELQYACVQTFVHAVRVHVMALGGVRSRGSRPHCGAAICLAVNWEAGVTSASRVSERVLLGQDDVC